MIEPVKAELVDKLDKLERGMLRRCEATIGKGQRAFVETADALTVIRDQRLYRETHSTFDAYCQDRWSFTRQRAQQVISAGETIKALPAAVAAKIDTERKARAIKPVATKPRQAAAAVKTAERSSANGEATAAAISTVVDGMTSKPPAGVHPETGEVEVGSADAEVWLTMSERLNLPGLDPATLRKVRATAKGIASTVDKLLSDIATEKRRAAAQTRTRPNRTKDVTPMFKGG